MDKQTRKEYDRQRYQRILQEKNAQEEAEEAAKQAKVDKTRAQGRVRQARYYQNKKMEAAKKAIVIR